MSTSRRHLLQWLGAAPLAAHATPEQGQAALSELLRGQAARPGRVTLDIPPLVENGNSVVMQVRVDRLGFEDLAFAGLCVELNDVGFFVVDPDYGMVERHTGSLSDGSSIPCRPGCGL